jgi:hypothetical protein
MSSHPNRRPWLLHEAADYGQMTPNSTWPADYEGAVLLAFRAGQRIPGDRRILDCRSTGSKEITISTIRRTDRADIEPRKYRIRFTGDRLEKISLEIV